MAEFDPLRQTLKRCPGCDADLRGWQLGELELDGCDTCGGCWFDGRELTAATRIEGEPLTALEAEFTAGLAGGAAAGRRRCPNCRGDLERFTFPHAPGVELDGCRGCGGIWFDEGELSALAATLPRDLRPRAGDHQAEAAVAVGLVASRCCPECGAANPELRLHCRACGAELQPPRPRREVEVTAVHRLRLGYLIGELALYVYLLAITIGGVHGRHGTLAELPDGWKAPVALVLLALFALRWLNRKLAVELRSDGILVRYLFRRRFFPWDSICSGAVFDLGSRAIWGAGDAASGWSRYGGGYHPGQSSLGVSFREWRDSFGRAVLILRTTRGLVTFGPDMSDHFGLIDAIRERM